MYGVELYAEGSPSGAPAACRWDADSENKAGNPAYASVQSSMAAAVHARFRDGKWV